jgi:hypothetical protein
MCPRKVLALWTVNPQVPGSSPGRGATEYAAESIT